MKTMVTGGLAALGLTLAAAPAQAAITTLDFGGDICGPSGTQSCGNGSQYGQGYGDGTGVDVSYRSVDVATGATFEPYLKFWDQGYGDLQRVVWGGSGPTGQFAEITFTALAGYELRLLGFDAGCYLNRASCQSFPFSISEIGGGEVASGTNVPPAGGHASQAFSFGYSQAGYILRWGPDAYDGGLDNIRFDVRAITAGNGVPEPATWALMILGFGAIGGAMRRRQSVVAEVGLA